MVVLSEVDSKKLSDLVEQLHRSTNNGGRGQFGEDYGRIAKKVIKSPKTLSETERLRIIAEYNAGASVKELAAKYYSHRANISSVLKSHGIKIVRRSRLPAAIIRRILQLRADGLSSRAIQTRIGINYKTVQRIINHEGNSE